MKVEKALTFLWRVLQTLILIIVSIVLLSNLYRLTAREIFKVDAEQGNQNEKHIIHNLYKEEGYSANPLKFALRGM